MIDDGHISEFLNLLMIYMILLFQKKINLHHLDGEEISLLIF